MAAVLQDVYSFVHKFLNLCNDGKKANLNLECREGKAFINLRLDLDVAPPQSCTPQPPPTSACMRLSPSRRRRSARRAQAQAAKLRNDFKSAVAEQVTAGSLSTAEKAVTNGATENLNTDHQICNPPAEQAEPEVILDQPVALQPTPVAQHQQEQDELDDSTKPSGKNSEKDTSKTLDDIKTDEFMNILEDFKINFTDSLKEGLRQGLTDAFKPP